MADSLTGFLLARIAEDEAVARSTRPYEYAAGEDGTDLDSAQVAGFMPSCITISSGRVLAECEAKRRIVGLHRNSAGSKWSSYGERYCNVCSDGDILYWNDQGEPEWPCATLRALALPYAGHPDFRPEWTI